MTANEMRDSFILAWAGGTVNNVPFNDREISDFLTKAELEVSKERFTPDKNTKMKGFERDSVRRAELAGLISATQTLKPDRFMVGTDVLPDPLAYIQGEDNYGVFVALPKEVLYVITEYAYCTNNSNQEHRARVEVLPIRYDSYNEDIDNRYRKPYHSLLWRMDWGNYTTATDENASTPDMTGVTPSYTQGGSQAITFNKDTNPIVHYLIPGKDQRIWGYTVFYIKAPSGIVVDVLYPANQKNSDLADSLHQDVVDKAVKLASASIINDANKYQVSQLESKEDE